MQIKRKIPKVNRHLAARIYENEEDDDEPIKDDSNEKKKPSRRNKGLGVEIFKDDRFGDMFVNEVHYIDICFIFIFKF